MLRVTLCSSKEISLEDLQIAIINHIVAKQQNKNLLIDIEDNSKTNEIGKKDKSILEILNLFTIEYSSVSYQSDYIKYYQKFAMQLLTQNKAFNCFCSNEALEQDKQQAKEKNTLYFYSGFCENLSDDTVLNVNAPFRVRVKKPTKNIIFQDILKGECNYTPNEVDSFEILHQDKTPTYNFSCAIDDMLFDISTVICSDKYLSDTPRQIYIRELLGYDKNIQYTHIPNNNDDILVNSLIEQGYLPIAIANYLLLLVYDTPNEIFTLEDAIKWFDITKISKKSKKFDIDKLNEINKIYLQNLDELRLSKILGYADKDIGILAKLYLNEVYTINQIKEKIDKIFSKKEPLEGFEDQFLSIKECLQKAPFIDNFDKLLEYIKKDTKLEDDKLLTPFRYILTKEIDGVVDLSQIYPLIKNYLQEIIK